VAHWAIAGEQHSTIGATAIDRQSFSNRGWVVLRGRLDPDTVDRISGWIEQVSAWADVGGPGLHHFEETGSGPVVARSERFADDHGDLGRFVRGGVASIVADLTGAEAVLFKEKVNYKHPGGGGFAAHQDATAYRFVEHHTSVMVPLDAATVRNGCLWFAPIPASGLLPASAGRIPADIVDSLEWEPVEVLPGDVVVFDSHAPHRSDTNRSVAPRRAMFLTYNDAILGDFRSAYYADKEAEFASSDGTFGGERVRMSVNDDFLGRPVHR